MENRTYYKKYLFIIILITALFLGFILLISELEYGHDKKVLNKKVDAIITELKTTNPKLTDEQILEIIESDKGNGDSLKKYGYDLERDNLLKENDNTRHHFTIVFTLTTLGATSLIIATFIFYSKKHSNEIDSLIKTLENINHHNYDLELETTSEDKMSILKSELYKTTVMLREVAMNSEKDKLNLKDTLSDISHQLKTPLTSILIMLDDIINDPSMPEETRVRFLNNMRREIININFLVQSILKLSKLDVNAIEFNPVYTDIQTIIASSIENISAIADLRNVTIEYSKTKKKKILCDATWQIEALTNILKNAVEHSPENGVVKISEKENDFYTEIIVTDDGTGLSKKDMRHIFDRFYKGANASRDSIGIGLSLAKSIIEKDNGKISVESKELSYTTFKIKYFH